MVHLPEKSGLLIAAALGRFRAVDAEVRWSYQVAHWQEGEHADTELTSKDLGRWEGLLNQGVAELTRALHQCEQLLLQAVPKHDWYLAYGTVADREKNNAA